MKNYMAGDKVGDLTILGPGMGWLMEKYSGVLPTVICRCKCNQVIELLHHDLNTKTCCDVCSGEVNRSNNFVNLVGRVFGVKLKVLSLAYKKNGNSLIWICKCMWCGKLRKVNTSDLMSGRVRSCGDKWCVKKEENDDAPY